MDKSLDEVIKENPKKFGRKGAKNPRRNNAMGMKNKNNSPLLTGVTKNSTGRVTKKQAAINVGKKRGNQAAPKQGGKVIVDARNKLLAKNRLKIVDARDKLAAITKKTTPDLRQKLSSRKPDPLKNSKGLRTRTGLQGIKPLMRDLGKSPLTRTIIGRTVENELARFSVVTPAQTLHQQYDPISRYDPLPASHYYPPYQQSATSFDFSRSTAAMDCSPPPSASQRIRTSGFVGASGLRQTPVNSESGHCVFVSNLHPKVTQDDIRELFGDVGPLVRASLLRPGVAEVIYVQRSHALKAVEAYHNRQLDGLPMHCSLASGREESRRDVAPPSSSKSSMTQSRGTGKASSHVAPDLSTIHRALFKKQPESNSSQIFTVTIAGKDRPVL